MAHNVYYVYVVWFFMLAAAFRFGQVIARARRWLVAIEKESEPEECALLMYSDVLVRLAGLTMALWGSGTPWMHRG